MEDFLASAREADDVRQVHFDQLEALLRCVTSAEEMREVLYSCIDAYSSNGDGSSNTSAYQQAILRAIALVLEYAQHYSHTSITAAVVTNGQHTASITPVALNASTSRMMPPPCYGVRYARLLYSIVSQSDSNDTNSVQRGADIMTNDSIQHRQQQRCWRLSLEDCLTLTLFFNELATLSEVRSFEYLCAAIATLFELCSPRVFAPLRGSQVDYSGVAVQGTSQSGSGMRTACHNNDEDDAAEEVNRTALRTELNALRVMLTRRLTAGNNNNSSSGAAVAHQMQRGSGKTNNNSNSGSSCRLHLIALNCVTRMLWSLLRCVAPDTRLVAMMHAGPQGITLPSHATKANDNVCHVVAGETAWDEQVSGAVQEILLAHMHDLLAPLRQAIDEQQQQQAMNTSAAAAGGGASHDQQGNSHSALGSASHSLPLLLAQLLHHIEHTLWLCQQLCTAASTALPPSSRTSATTNGGNAKEGIEKKEVEEEVVGDEKDTQGDGTGVTIVKAVYRHTVSGVLTLLQKYLTLQQQLQRQKLTLGSPDGTDFVSSTSLQAHHGLTGQHNTSEWMGDVLRAYGVQRGLQRVLSVVLAETMTGMLPPPAPTRQSASEAITITDDSAAQHNAALRQAAAAALMAFGGAVSVRSPFCPSTLHSITTTMTSLASLVGAGDEMTAAEETQAGEERTATGRVTSHDMAQAALTWQSHEEAHAVNEEQQDDEEDDVEQSGARLRADTAARLRACQALLRNNSDSVMLRKGRHTLQGNEEEEEENALRGAADEDEDEDDEDDALAASMLGDGQGMLLLAHANTTGKKDGAALLSPAMSALRRGLGGPIASAALSDMVLLSLTGMDLLEPNRVRDMHLHGLNAMQYNAAIKAQRAELERQRLLAQRGVEAIAPGRLLEHVANSTAVRQRGVQRLRRVSARARLERAAFSSVLRSYAAVVGRRVVTEATVRAAQALVARCLVQLPSALADSALDELLLQLREELHAEYALRHGGNTNNVELNDVVGLVESDDGVVGSVVNRMGSYYELTLQVLFASYATQAPMQERGSHALLLLDGHAAPRLAETASLLPSSSMALTAANGNNEEVNGGGVRGSVAVLQSHTTLRLDTDNPVAFLHASDETHGMTTMDAAAVSVGSGAVKLELKQEVGMARLGTTHKRPRPAGDNATHNRDVYGDENNSHDSNSSSDDDGDAARETFDFANDTMTRPSPYSHTLCRVLELLEAAKLNALLLDVLLQAPALTRYVWAYLYRRFCLSSDKARCVIGLWLLTHLALKRPTTRSAAVNLLLQLSLSSREYVRRLAIRQLATLLAARGADGRAVMDRSAEAALVRYAVRQLATLPACTLSAAARKASTLINTTTATSQQHDNEAAMTEKNNTNNDSNAMEGGAALVERERHQLAELLNRYLGLFLMLCVRQPQQLMPSLLNVYKQCVEANNTVMASLLPENGDVYRMTRHLLRSNTAAFMATVLPLLRRHAADARLLVQAMLRAMNEELRAMAQPETSPQEQQQQQKSDEESLRWVATTLLGHARAMYNAGAIPLQRPVVMSSQQQSLPLQQPTTASNNSSSAVGAMAGDVGGDAESATAAQLHDIRFVAPFLSFLPASELRRHYLRSFLYFVQVQLQFQRQYGQAMPTLSAKERSYVLTPAELKAFIKEVIREVVVRCAVKFNDGVVRGLSRVDFFVYLHRAPQESSSNTMNSNSTMSDMTSGTTTAATSTGYRVPPQHDATMATNATMSSGGGTSSNSVFRAPVQLNSSSTVIAPPVGMAQGVTRNKVGDGRHYASHASSLLPAPTSAVVMPVVKEEPHVHGGVDESASLVTGSTTSAAQTMADAIALPPIGAVTTKEVIGVCLALTRSFDNTTTERLYGPQEVQKAIQKLLQQGPPLPSQLMATVLLAAALFARQRGNEFVRFVVYEVLPVLERTATWESDPRLWKGVLFFIEKYYRECSGFLVSLPDQVLMQALREQPQLCEYFKQEHGNNASFGHILGNL